MYKNRGGKNLENQRIQDAVRKFSNLIERNKDYRAYSDYKEGINEGLEIAKDTFEEHVETFDLSNMEEDQTIKIKRLQNKYNLLIDTIEVRKKPNYSEEQLEGIHKGFERSKVLFGEFIKGYA